MQHPTDVLRRTAPSGQLCPGFLRKRSMRLEKESVEETEIREVEKQIGKARRKPTTPVDSLKKEARRNYKSWLERLNRELETAKTEKDRDAIERQLERATQQYSKWSDS